MLVYLQDYRQMHGQ